MKCCNLKTIKGTIKLMNGRPLSQIVRSRYLDPEGYQRYSRGILGVTKGVKGGLRRFPEGLKGVLY